MFINIYLHNDIVHAFDKIGLWINVTVENSSIHNSVNFELFLKNFQNHLKHYIFPSQKTSVARKKSSTPKSEDTEQSPPPFAGMKLKKTTTVKRESREETLPFVELKHHEFEILPQDEEVLNLLNYFLRANHLPGLSRLNIFSL